MTKTADGMSRVVETTTINGLVPWYMMAALMYYHFDFPILSDARFDEIGKTLKENWASIKHDHKHFITEGDLDAGTLMLKIEQYPWRTRAAAQTVAQSLGWEIDDEAKARLWVPFLPPEDLRDNAELYPYGSRDGKSWLSHQPKVEPEVRVRTRVRAAPPVAPEPEPEVRVRTRVRPA